MNEDERIREELSKSASKIDGATPHTPDFQFFRDMVERQQATVRRSQRRQLALFVLVAAALVSAVILCMGAFGFFFLALQGAAVAGSIAGLAVFIIRSRRLKAGANG